VALELAEVAAGFPLAASFAIAGGITALREGRRRSALNEAMHELRRPLQVLALSLPENPAAAERLDSSLRMTAAAAARLERAINGEREIEPAVPVPLGLVAAVVAERWQPLAKRTDRPLQLRWTAGESRVAGSRIELEQVVDNLISNAYEHGTGPVLVEARIAAGLLRVTVRDAGPRDPAPPRAGRRRLRGRIDGRGRHGHGLRVVRRAVARHGGRFRLHSAEDGTEAIFELPLLGARR
jgi:signal transduction histidine kinase